MTRTLTLARALGFFLVLVTALAVLPARARTPMYTYTATKTYEVSGGVLSNVSGPDPTCDANHKNCRITSDGSIDLGSVTFPPIGGTGKVNLAITIKDTVNILGAVPAEACQDLNGDRTCGNNGEPDVAACFRAGKSVTLAGINRSQPVTVFIFPVGGCPSLTAVANGQGSAVTGSVTISTLLPIVPAPRVISKLTHTFTANEACAAACAYYVDPGSQAVQDSAKSCTAPGPAGSFADFVVTAPAGANQLNIGQKPTVDWDVVVCAKPANGNNGSFIAFETTDPNCPTVAVGCTDTLMAPIVAGRSYVIRDYNFADPPASSVVAQIQWRRV